MTIAEKKAQIETRFNDIMAKIHQTEAQLNELKSEALRLQGAYRELDDMDAEKKGGAPNA